MMAILTHVRRYLIVLICVSLIINDVEHLACASWPSVYLLWKNVCFDLPIFWFGALIFFDIELHELFVFFGDQSLMVCLQIFSLILWVFFILLMVSFATQNPLENFSMSSPFRQNQKQSLYITCCFRKGWHPRILSHTPQDILSLFLILSHVEWQREIGLS